MRDEAWRHFRFSIDSELRSVYGGSTMEGCHDGSVKNICRAKQECKDTNFEMVNRSINHAAFQFAKRSELLYLRMGGGTI